MGGDHMSRRALKRRYGRSFGSAFRQGEQVYAAFTDSVDRGVIVERGMGGYNRKRTVRDPYVVRITSGVDAGGEFPLSGRDLFVDPLAASIRSADLYREAMSE